MRVRVVVTPGARRERVESLADDRFKIAVKEPAVGNQANERVRAILATLFHVHKKDVRPLTGMRGKNKMFTLVLRNE